MLIDTAILGPAAVLALWTLVVLFWVMGTRMPAFAKAGISLSEVAPGSRYADAEAAMPPSVNWKSHNHTHLLEQPTLFYAICVILALAGEGSGLNLTLAWGYAGLRVMHSIWQCMINTLPVRFTLFLLSSLCLVALTVNAVLATVF